MAEVKYDHKKKTLASALGLTDQRFNELKEKVGLVGFLSQARSEALEIVSKDDTIAENEKPIVFYLTGALFEQ